MRWAKIIAWLKCRPWTGILISVSCIALIVLRGIYPAIFTMDAASVALLVVAVAPWIRSAIKSIELAGIGKIELNDVEAVAKEVGASDLPTAGDVEVTPADVEADLASKGNNAEERTGDPTAAGDAGHKSDAPVANANFPKMSFQEWVKRIRDEGGWGETSDGKAVVDLDFGSSSLSIKRWRQARVDRARDSMLALLRYLCQLNDISPLGLSVFGMLDRLQSCSAITSKQANGISAAAEMVNSVLQTPTTPEAMQRTLDVAREVNESLAVLVRKAEIVRLARDRNAAINSGDGKAEK